MEFGDRRDPADNVAVELVKFFCEHPVLPSCGSIISRKQARHPAEPASRQEQAVSLLPSG
jgi:hypothetical protein